jgi:hypothetical protein
MAHSRKGIVMPQKTQTRVVAGLVGLVLLAAFVLSLALAPSAQAGQATGMAAVSPLSPLRPKEKDSGRVDSAQIRLVVSPDPGGLMSVVQWQGDDGNWNDVEGWRGQVINGITTWWVEPRDFGKDSFRWVVYDPNSGAQLAATEPFALPKSAVDVVYTLVLE